MPKAIVTIQVRGTRRRHELAAGELSTIGRGTSCAIQIQDSSVSREHCVAVFTGALVCINDLASTHGVVQDGERRDRCELKPGESLQLGAARFTFERIDGAESAAAPEGHEVSPREGPAPAAPAKQAEAPAAPPPAQAPRPEPERPADQAPPVEIAGYRILEQLGAGGYATVYRAQQVRLSREVALKVLRLDAAGAEAATRIEAFQREARAAAALNDPHLVQVYDVGHDGDTHYLSMELVAGGSLAQRIKREGPLPWRVLLPILRDIALALKVAHQNGFVHRDVKPANILLTDDDQAKLTDLGLAGGLFEAGTIAFMAPEQILRREVDGRADLYALGCTAYAALTGRPPFVGDKTEIARAHVKDEPASFQKLGARAPWHLEELIVDALMAKDPADRPPSAADLIDRIDRLVLPEAEPRAKVDKTTRVRAAMASGSKKAFLAKLTGELVVFTMVALVVIAALLALKVISPELDIYRLIGK
ncbi:MAG: FHA domain-containing serine/threonine-protein kinase [Planctomycetota bacterium]